MLVMNTIGCGVSTLFGDMLKDDWKGTMLGIDYAPSVVAHMRGVYPSSTSEYKSITFDKIDAHDMNTLADASFDFIIDKATTDGLLCSPESAAKTPDMYSEVARVLAEGGLYVICSVNDPDHGWFSDYVMSSLVSTCPNNKWQVVVHSMSPPDGEGDDDNDDNEGPGPNVYMIRKHGRSLRSRTKDASDSFTVEQQFH
jgi:ubiquinone/menaquinone biosynthesis C-methylase UbiE